VVGLGPPDSPAPRKHPDADRPTGPPPLRGGAGMERPGRPRRHANLSTWATPSWVHAAWTILRGAALEILDRPSSPPGSSSSCPGESVGWGLVAAVSALRSWRGGGGSERTDGVLKSPNKGDAKSDSDRSVPLAVLIKSLMRILTEAFLLGSFFSRRIIFPRPNQGGRVRSQATA
jgi:hypothetical protein